LPLFLFLEKEAIIFMADFSGSSSAIRRSAGFKVAKLQGFKVLPDLNGP
jgi:hypothetical protein